MKSRLEMGIKPALGMRCYLLDCDALLDIVCDIGCELLESGAETYRVEESVSRIVRAFAGMEASVFAVPTCVIVSITRTGGGSETKRGVSMRGERISTVLSGSMTFAAVFAEENLRLGRRAVRLRRFVIRTRPHRAAAWRVLS